MKLKLFPLCFIPIALLFVSISMSIRQHRIDNLQEKLNELTEKNVRILVFTAYESGRINCILSKKTANFSELEHYKSDSIWMEKQVSNLFEK